MSIVASKRGDRAEIPGSVFSMMRWLLVGRLKWWEDSLSCMILQPIPVAVVRALESRFPILLLYDR
jgi:hypothetical protein